MVFGLHWALAIAFDLNWFHRRRHDTNATVVQLGVFLSFERLLLLLLRRWILNLLVTLRQGPIRFGQALFISAIGLGGNGPPRTPWRLPAVGRFLGWLYVIVAAGCLTYTVVNMLQGLEQAVFGCHRVVYNCRCVSVN